MAANALPLRNGQFREHPASSLSAARSNVPHQLSSFGYMLVTSAMNEDLSPTSLVSPPPAPPGAHSLPFINTSSTGQMRPLSSGGALSATLPMRNPAVAMSNSQSPLMPQQRFHRIPQRTPSLGSASEASTSSSSLSSSGSSEMEVSPSTSSPNSDGNVKRKDVDGDCSICWEPFEQTQNELIWCKLTCGNNFHKKCFVEWLLTPKHSRTSPDLKCPYCRGAWDPAELRTLQVEKGIIPPRPYKRARPDLPQRALSRDTMRRHYRERREQARREFQATVARANGADRYRPGMPTQQPHHYHGMGYISPPSMRSTPGVPPSTPHASPPAIRPMYAHQPYPMPHGPQSMAPRQPMMPHFGGYLPAFPAQPTPMPPLANVAAAASSQSHDLTAPGYNIPTFAPNPYLAPMAMQQQQQRPTSMPAGPSQPQMSRCPAMRMQQAPPPPGMGVGMPTSPPFCPGMMPAAFEVQLNHYQYHAYYHFGPPVP